MSKFIKQIEQATQDSIKRLKEAEDIDKIKFITWPQVWPNESCGFETLGEKKTTIAQAVVCIGKTGDVAVYHGGKFVFYIENPKEDFWLRLRSFNMPGKNETLVL